MHENEQVSKDQMGKNSKVVKGTNIVLAKSKDLSELSQGNAMAKQLAILESIEPDDTEELRWDRKQRPDRMLQNTSEAFLQGTKKLRPALNFNTFDAKKAKQ